MCLLFCSTFDFTLFSTLLFFLYYYRLSQQDLTLQPSRSLAPVSHPNTGPNRITHVRPLLPNMTTPLPSLTLYRRNGACTLASHILLTHLNIPFTEVIMDIGEGGLHAADGSLSNAEYRKIHHSGCQCPSPKPWRLSPDR